MAEQQRNPQLMNPKAMEAVAGTRGAGENVLLFSEILTKVNNAKDKPKKIAVLRQYDNAPLRQVLKGAFDKNIVWDLPAGDPPYIVQGSVSDVIREFAPTIVPSLKVTPGKTEHCTPSVAKSSNTIGSHILVRYFEGTTGDINPCLKSSVEQTILPPSPIFVKLPIVNDANFPPIIVTHLAI